MDSKTKVLDVPVAGSRWNWRAGGSMAVLTLQSTALSICLRLSRTRAGAPYLASVTVLLTEAVKMALCCLAVATWSHDEGGSSNAKSSPVAQLQGSLRGAAPMAVPAACFVLQQVLLVAAAGRLDAVTFQVFTQGFKLVPTAVLAWAMLGQRLRAMQWASIPLLSLGVVLVSLNGGDAGGSSSGPGSGARGTVDTASSTPTSNGAQLLGSLACAVSGLSSAFAGVHFEKFLKSDRRQSLVVRNVQLGAFGLPLSAAMVILRDGHRIRSAGLLQGFDSIAWTVVGLQAVGGLAMGAVVKHCDNVVKNFALAVSVVLTVALAVPLFGQIPGPWFLLGVGCILLSVSMYAGTLQVPILATWLGSLHKAAQGRLRGCLSGAKACSTPAQLCALSMLSMLLLGASMFLLSSQHGAAHALFSHRSLRLDSLLDPGPT